MTGTAPSPEGTYAGSTQAASSPPVWEIVVPVLVGVLLLLVCAFLLFRRRRKRLHSTTQLPDGEKLDLAASSASSRELPKHVPSDGTASDKADTAVSAQHRDPLPDPATRAATDAAAHAAPAQNGSAALIAGTPGQAKPRSLFWNVDQKGPDDSAARLKPAIPDEESAPLPVPAQDLQHPSQIAADVRVLAIPDPARDEVRADQERAFAKFAGASGAARPSDAQPSEPAASSTTVPGANATADGDLRSQLSLLRRRMQEQQQLIDQMRAERLAEEQRERADTRSEPESDAPPAYEGE
jgi:LPXTG-motif cell wall-anchored protein